MPSIEVLLIRPIARTVRIGFLPQGHRQPIFLNYLQAAFNARHTPNESNGSPDVEFAPWYIRAHDPRPSDLTKDAVFHWWQAKTTQNRSLKNAPRDRGAN
jgi:hypothetical protein